MFYGYRVIKEEEICLYHADLIQISVYEGFKNGMDHVMKAISTCRFLNIRYVMHPVGYFLSETNDNHRMKTMEVMLTIAKNTDLALIVHDETTPWGTRLEGPYEKAYREALLELSAICPVSIENANNTHDIEWFWRKFATSITLDIGHVEAAGIDSVRFVKELKTDLLDKLSFVHLHRYGFYGDHLGLLEGCKELKALECLLERKNDIGVILEINDKKNIGKSLKLLERLKKANYC